MPATTRNTVDRERLIAAKRKLVATPPLPKSAILCAPQEIQFRAMQPPFPDNTHDAKPDAPASSSTSTDTTQSRPMPLVKVSGFTRPKPHAQETKPRSPDEQILPDHGGAQGKEAQRRPLTQQPLKSTCQPVTREPTLFSPMYSTT